MPHAKLETRIAKSLPKGLKLPPPLGALFGWLEENGHVAQTRLGPTGRLPDGTGQIYAEFHSPPSQLFGEWLGNDDAEVLAQLGFLGTVGSDGSMVALWCDDEGKQHIVHLGSGSGSTLCCVLADDPVDFLRLLALGSDDLFWLDEDELSKPLPRKPSPAFRSWVEKTFSVTIPRSAARVVKHPATMDEGPADDPFWQWVEDHRG